MKLGDIRRKATNGSLQVEDLLKAAKQGIPGLADEVMTLCNTLNWDRQDISPNGSFFPPMGKWARVVAAYARDGLEGLRTLVNQNTQLLPFALGLVEEIKTIAAVQWVMTICPELVRKPSGNTEAAERIARTLNFLLSFKGAPTLPIVLESQVREFLHNALDAFSIRQQLETAVLALRGLGNEESLAKVNALYRSELIRNDVGEASIRAIKRRIKGRLQGEQPSSA